MNWNPKNRIKFFFRNNEYTRTSTQSMRRDKEELSVGTQGF